MMSQLSYWIKLTLQFYFEPHWECHYKLFMLKCQTSILLCIVWLLLLLKLMQTLLTWVHFCWPCNSLLWLYINLSHRNILNCMKFASISLGIPCQGIKFHKYVFILSVWFILFAYKITSSQSRWQRDSEGPEKASITRWKINTQY